MISRWLLASAVLLMAAATTCSAFVLPTGKAKQSSSNPKINTSHETTTRLDAALLPSVVTNLSPPLRNTIVLSTAASAVAVSIYRSHKKKGLPDANFSEPLPEGKLGCTLLGNIEFYTKQGSVELRVCITNDNKLEIAVIDTGIGIKEEDKSKLFKLFGFVQDTQ